MSCKSSDLQAISTRTRGDRHETPLGGQRAGHSRARPRRVHRGGLCRGGHGHGGGDHGHRQSHESPASGGDNSHGVKPSSSTQHDTYARASSDKTKEYGNHETAGEIATQSGYGSATLHGPGNSQPHKTACAGHEVDVHALKSHGSRCGSTQAASVEQASPQKKPCPKKHAVEAIQVEQKHETPVHAVAATQTTAAPAPAPAPASAAGGVKGAVVTLSPKTTRTAAAPAKAKPQGGVLGTTTRLGSAVSGTRLPFTGLPLWIFAAAAAGLIMIGAAVRRSADDRV